jgi:callose synthase
MALYLLIWGEAANIRFLPECLCYIFHHMADEMYDLLEKPRVERSEKIYIEGSQHSFLEKIICPIHEILAAESDVPVRGRAAHSAWRNYDDFNEFFWAPSCFELSWPWRLEAGFFLKPNKDVDTDDDNVRKYLLSFRSLNRKCLWQCFFKCLLVGSAEVPAEIALSHVLKIY